MENLIDDVRAERRRFGNGNWDPRAGEVKPLTKNECVALLNAVAWKNRAGGWGLAGKTSGNRGRRSDGVECSVDGLVHKASNTFVDVLVASETTAAPDWQVGTVGGNKRRWVAPIDPGVDAAEPELEQPAKPEGLSEPGLASDDALGRSVREVAGRLSEVLARLEALERSTAAVERRINEVEAGVHEALRTINVGVAATRDLRVQTTGSSVFPLVLTGTLGGPKVTE